MCEEGIPEIELDVPRGADDDAADHEAADAARGGDGEGQARVEQQLGARDVAAEVVDGVLQHPRREQRDRRRGHDASKSEDISSAIADNEPQQTAGGLVQGG